MQNVILKSDILFFFNCLIVQLELERVIRDPLSPPGKYQVFPEEVILTLIRDKEVLLCYSRIYGGDGTEPRPELNNCYALIPVLLSRYFTKEKHNCKRGLRFQEWILMCAFLQWAFYRVLI